MQKPNASLTSNTFKEITQMEFQDAQGLAPNVPPRRWRPSTSRTKWAVGKRLFALMKRQRLTFPKNSPSYRHD